jgi:hypothetical protein
MEKLTERYPWVLAFWLAAAVAAAFLISPRAASQQRHADLKPPPTGAGVGS